MQPLFGRKHRQNIPIDSRKKRKFCNTLKKAKARQREHNIERTRLHLP